MKQRCLYLIDGHSYIYRAFFALPHFSNTKGLPTNAIYGFTSMLWKILRDQSPDLIGVAFDTDKPTLRHERFEAYKAHRPSMPENLVVQLPYILRTVEAFRVAVLMQDGFEADDLIATAARRAADAGLRVIIVTGDKDMLQMVGPGIEVYDPMRGRRYDESQVQARLGVSPVQVADLLGLMGDKVDNIPGVPGVGEKTAVGLLREYGTLDDLYARVEELKRPALKKKLQEHEAQARLSRDLATLRQDASWEGRIQDLEKKEPDPTALKELFKEMEFASLLKQLDPSDPTTNSAAGSGEAASAGSTAPRQPAEDGPERLEEFRRLGASGRPIGICALFGKDGERTGPLQGLAFSIGSGENIYVPMIGSDPGPAARILEDPDIPKVGHQLKPVYLALARLGIRMRGARFDTQLGAYLLAPSRRVYELEMVANEFLENTVEPPPPLWHATPENTCRRAAERVVAISSPMEQVLTERGQIDLYRDVEFPLIEVLAGMERSGFRIDVAVLADLSKELQVNLEALVDRIYRLAGCEFNLNSPKQLSNVLFDRLGLKPVKKTKTGFSTDEAVLSQLSRHHELPGEILNYRQLAKLKSTYVDALPPLVDSETGRLHTTFHQTATATGRLSSSDPNLQNIPVRGEWGKRIRAAFKAARGYRLMSADYNQIELRILAHLSQDQGLIDAFREGVDIHTSTACRIFGLPPHLISSEMRRAAKTVNFGVIYGMGPFALSGELGTSQAEAKQYINNYFQHYAGVKRFVEKTIEEAMREGYVKTVFNRRREIPELKSVRNGTRNLGERLAVNTVIQGSAADMIKLAMVRIARRLEQENLGARMILQIHDELIVEIPEHEVPGVEAVVATEMENVLPLFVPIRVDRGIGQDWAAIH